MNFEIVWDTLPRFFSGALLTIEITAVSVAIGLLLAVPLAIFRVSRNPLLSWPVQGFTFFFRGTPLLVQLFLVYYGAGQFSDTLRSVGLWFLFRDPWFCGVFTLTLNTAAYTCEILRGGIQAVPHGEVEAARAFGMSGAKLYRRIILPKAARIALPAYSNEVIFLLQATSLVSLITLMDITGVASRVAARSFAFYELYLTAAVFYLVIVYGLQGAFRRVERRLSGHLRERPDAEPASLRG
ncbi:ABC transporter permease [Algihabitans albus]|uniref:ABC transporter permease n=1 Tax=Algihabitans albus TaxID=2164067 RepID=UPI0035CFE728